VTALQSARDIELLPPNAPRRSAARLPQPPGSLEPLPPAQRPRRSRRGIAPDLTTACPKGPVGARKKRRILRSRDGGRGGVRRGGDGRGTSSRSCRAKTSMARFETSRPPAREGWGCAIAYHGRSDAQSIEQRTDVGFADGQSNRLCPTTRIETASPSPWSYRRPLTETPYCIESTRLRRFGNLMATTGTLDA